MPIKLAIVDGDIATQIDPVNIEIGPQNIKWPKDSIVVYAIDEETLKIKGRSSIVHFGFIEGTEIFDEELKGTKLFYTLINKIEEIVQLEGHLSLFTMTPDDKPEIANYVKRLGYKKFPASIYIKDFREEIKKVEEKAA